MADGVTRPGFFPQLAHRLGARSFDFDMPDLRMSTLLASDSDLGHAFSDAWALLREEVDGVVDVTPGLLSHPAETVPAQHRMQHAITAQREAAAARRLDVLMLALPRTDPRRHSWLEAGDSAQIAGRWLASHPSERFGLVCSCSEFSEMLVSYLGVDSPAASSPGVLGASFSGYSGGPSRYASKAPCSQHGLVVRRNTVKEYGNRTCTGPAVRYGTVASASTRRRLRPLVS